MGRLINTFGQVRTSLVHCLMPAFLPEETAGYVIYPSAACNECGGTTLPVISLKFFPGKPAFLH